MAKHNEPVLPKINLAGKPFKPLTKYAIMPQLPKNDPLIKYIKERTKDDRR